jgi:hypothetical protein
MHGCRSSFRTTIRCTLRIAAVLLGLHASRANADDSQPRPRVLVVGPSDTNPIIARMRDELALVGLEVEVVPEELGSAKPEELLTRYGAVAIAIVGDSAQPSAPPGKEGSDRVLLRVPARYRSDGESSETVEVVGTQHDADLLALRAVELLRGKLLPVERLRAAVAAPEPEAQPAPPAPQPEPRSTTTTVHSIEKPTRAARAPSVTPPEKPAAPPRLRLYLAPAVVAGPGGVPPTPNIRVGADIHLGWRISTSIHVLAPTAAANVTTAQGSMSLRTVAFGGGLDATFTPPAWDFGVFGGLGVDAAALGYSGTASPPLRANRSISWTVAPGAEIGVRYRLSRWFALRADEAILVLAPEPVLRVAGSEVATFGRPLSVTTAGLEVTP